MFTGIVQGLGKVQNIKNDNEVSIITDLDLTNCRIGSSISCNGICLTLISLKNVNKSFIFSVNIGEETKFRTNAKFWKNNFIINLEKSLKVGDEIGGHFVYGHIDCITKILKIQKLKSSWNFIFKNNINMKKFILEKGSISINGISLTIANISKNNFSISVIPHTFDNTNLNIAKKNDLVNIEFDVLARYAVKNE